MRKKKRKHDLRAIADRSLGGYSPLQHHANTAFVDEFDAGGFESIAKNSKGAAVRRPGFDLEHSDGRNADFAAVGKVALLPSKERTSGTALRGSDHAGI